MSYEFYPMVNQHSDDCRERRARSARERRCRRAEALTALCAVSVALLYLALVMGCLV